MPAGDFSENADDEVEDYKLMEAHVLQTYFDENAPRLTAGTRYAFIDHRGRPWTISKHARFNCLKFHFERRLSSEQMACSPAYLPTHLPRRWPNPEISRWEHPNSSVASRNLLFRRSLATPPEHQRENSNSCARKRPVYISKPATPATLKLSERATRVLKSPVYICLAILCMSWALVGDDLYLLY